MEAAQSTYEKKLEAQYSSHMKIEPVNRANFEKALPLIAAYQRFYGMTPNEEQNRSFFQQFLDDHTRGVIFLACDQEDGAAIGMATLYFLPSSLSAKISCTFNDLYAVPGVRGKGVGVSLGAYALLYARDRGHKKVYWLTQPSNKVAQKIYEFTGAQRSEWYMYDLVVDAS
jgi:GNAT superfamily N-acetyltransferase